MKKRITQDTNNQCNMEILSDANEDIAIKQITNGKKNSKFDPSFSIALIPYYREPDCFFEPLYKFHTRCVCLVN